ncbi:MAG: TetR/AcrR family transcriptional regulator [Chitinophagaceae bacterium]|nr:TetR/AcrR family transcriptional regulator [Chitinophagaceae bacterium]
MGITERRIREKEKVRETIIAKAWEMVQADGWEALSIRKIADAIEYSVPVIYDHFENKEAILSEFAKEGFRILSKKMEQAKQKAANPVEQLKAMADAYWNFAMKNTAYYRLMYGVGMQCCSGLGKDKEGFDDHVTDTIRQIVAKTKYKNTNVCLKYHTFWSILHGLVSIKITEQSRQDRELNKLVLQDAIEGFIKNLK